MMKNPVPEYLQKKAEELNGNACKIDSSLFFFCNYEDNHLPAFSPYDCFVQDVQELYKFSIDCCPLNRAFLYPPAKYSHFSSCVSAIPAAQKNEYEQIYKDIRVLRAVYDHNNSEKSNDAQKNNLNDFRATFVRIVGFEHDAADLHSEAFEKACDNLFDYAKKIVALVEKFAVYIGELPETEKMAVAQEWKAQILFWYSNNTKRDYFRYYIAPNLPLGAFKNYMVGRRNPRKKLGEHIKEIVDMNQRYIRNLETAPEEALRAFKNTYENGVGLPNELTANTPQEAKKRLEGVNTQLETIIGMLPDRDYGMNFLDVDCQTALFEATRQVYPTCSLLPQEFYDYVVYKLLILR